MTVILTKLTTEPYQNYCYNKETDIHVYHYLMAISISSFNPCFIPKTQEKQLYQKQVIPTSAWLVQNYVENAIGHDKWNVNVQQEQKKWSAKKNQISIVKHLGLKADSHDRTNHGNIRVYDLGEDPGQCIHSLKDKKIFSSFLI